FPVAARQRLAHAPLVQAFVVGRVGHQRQQARRIGQVRRHRPQRGLVQHAAALGLGEVQRLRDRRQLRLGGERVVLGQLRQSVRGDQPAARGLRPLRGARVRRLDEGGVVVGQRQLLGGQAAGGGAHHARFPFGGG